jgi:hypothetical protein
VHCQGPLEIACLFLSNLCVKQNSIATDILKVFLTRGEVFISCIRYYHAQKQSLWSHTILGKGPVSKGYHFLSFALRMCFLISSIEAVCQSITFCEILSPSPQPLQSTFNKCLCKGHNQWLGTHIGHFSKRAQKILNFMVNSTWK